MDALEQIVERELSLDGDDQLAVQDEARRLNGPEVIHHLREVARQRLAGLRLQQDLVAVAEGDAAEAVPFRLVEPLASHRQLGHEFGFHRREGRPEGQAHRNFSSFTRPVFAMTGAHRSPTSAIRSRALSRRKSSMAMPRSTSSQVTGVETGARGRGLGEYTEASVRPHAFWL